MGRTKMKTFILVALAGFAAAGPSPLTGSHQVVSGHGAHNSHAVNHAASVAVSHSSPVLTHAAPLQYHAAPVTVAHPASTLLTHPAPTVLAHAAPVQYHAAPIAVAHATPAYETEKPYSYQYGVADDYSSSNFNAAENADAAGNVQGSYSVALPDGRIQTVKYTSDNYNGYVADVSYEGTPVHPPAAVPVAAPAYQG